MQYFLLFDIVNSVGSYKDRFSLLAESMEREKRDIRVRESAQTKVAHSSADLSSKFAKSLYMKFLYVM